VIDPLYQKRAPSATFFLAGATMLTLSQNVRLPVTHCGIATCLHRAIGTTGLAPVRLRPSRPLHAYGGLLPVTRHQEAVRPVGTTSSGSRLATGRWHGQPPSRRSAGEAGGGSRWYTQPKGGIPDGAVAKERLNYLYALSSAALYTATLTSL
jgi:hypothetical protein